jgi:hypothetical protein
MLENLKRIIQQETPVERRQRMIPAAIYGALVATAYVWAFYLVNVYTFPELPLSLDWLRLIGSWISLALAFGLFGALAAWFTEEYAGGVGGALIFTMLLALWFLIAARTGDSSMTAQSIITTLPLIGVNMLGAWGLRWAAHRHIVIVNEKDTGTRRKQMVKHISIIFLIGLLPGLFGRMDLPSERVLEKFHELLQAAPTDPSVWPRLPLKQVPSLQDHFGVDYRLYARQSSISVGAMDVNVRFADGYEISCRLPIATEIQFITTCSEGRTYTPGP